MARRSSLMLGAVALAMSASPLAVANSHTMTTYDDFNSKWIDPDKWEGDSVRGVMETVWRVAEDGYLSTGLRGFSDITKDGSMRKNRNSLYINEDVAGGVHAFGADVMVDWGYVRGCPGSDESDSEARFRVGGFFFNSGGSAMCDDRTGDIFAQMYLRDRDDDGMAKDQYAVVASVWRCDDAKCDTGTSMFYDRIGTVMEKEMINLNVSWDDANNMFHFSSDVGNVSYDYSADMVNEGVVAGRGYSKGIQTTTNISNCVADSAVRPYGVIDASVDNFFVNDSFKSLADTMPARQCETPGTGGSTGTGHDNLVVGEWHQGYFAYKGDDGNFYRLRRDKWFVWNGERYKRDDAAGNAQFSGKMITRWIGNVPAEQLQIRKDNREALRAARKEARAAARAARIAERAAKREARKAARKAAREAAKKAAEA